VCLAARRCAGRLQSDRSIAVSGDCNWRGYRLETLSVLCFAQGRAQEALAVTEDGLARWRVTGTCGVFRLTL
jgi:hypothetical protein